MENLSKLFEFVKEDGFSSLSSTISTKQLVLHLDMLGYSQVKIITDCGYHWCAFPSYVNGSSSLEVLLS